jgi:hypothetical protein
MPTILTRWVIGLAVALSATAMYALALVYFAPDAALPFGRVAGFVCLTGMFAGVAFVRGKVIFRRLVPLAGIVTLALMLLFAALASASGLATVPAPAFIALALLPVVLFGGVVMVRMLIRVW